MEPLREKIVGSWVGMAVGDAMGRAVKGLKPETIRQYFGRVDGFKDVRPFIGKGIKQYRMRGLYSTLTQSALVVCDGLLRNRKVDPQEISDQLLKLSAGGHENNFGVYREPEGSFRKTVGSFPVRSSLIPAEVDDAGCGFVTLAVPIALYCPNDTPSMMRQCVDVGLLMTRNVWEVAGVAVTGFLITRLLAMKRGTDEDAFPREQAAALLENAAAFCGEAETLVRERLGEGADESPEDHQRALSRTLRGLIDLLSSSREEVSDWICRNASDYVKTPINHPAQGHVLTLLPLSLVLVLQGPNDFGVVLTEALHLGREANKLGALVGALAGALYGFSAIPDPWKSGLVNGREIKTRGEALFLRRLSKELKGLYEMESGLTAKEWEEKRKYLPKTLKKPARKAASRSLDIWDEDSEESPVPAKEDVVKWRRFQKDKTRMKRDRRRHLKSRPKDI